MPRYYFHFTDGQRHFSDDKGQDLAGLRAARERTTQQVRELKAAMSEPAIRDLSGWSMNVTDGRGRTVFVLGFDLKPRPVVPLPPDAPLAPVAPLTPDAPQALRAPRQTRTAGVRTERAAGIGTRTRTKGPGGA